MDKIETSDDDIPSDFFDDLIEGFDIVDTWNDAEIPKERNSRIGIEVLDSAKDLQELIEKDKLKDDSYTYKHERTLKKRSRNRSSTKNFKYIDTFIKPGSRRDLKKTTEAIKKDKEVKVKEHLAKHLQSSYDLKPPGTELDDFYDNKPLHSKEIHSHGYIKDESPLSDKLASKRGPRNKSPPSKLRKYDRSPKRSPSPNSKHIPHRGLRHSPRRIAQHSPHHSPRRSTHHSPRRSTRHSPHRSTHHSPRRSTHHSPRKNTQDSPRRSTQHSAHRSTQHSPHRSTHRSPGRSTHRSPRRSTHRSPRRSTHRSPRRSTHRSPRRSTHRSPHRSIHRSPGRSPRNSPYQRSEYLHRSRSPIELAHGPKFTLTNNLISAYEISSSIQPSYQMQQPFPTSIPYSYSNVSSLYNSGSYDYAAQTTHPTLNVNPSYVSPAQVPVQSVSIPQPVPAPAIIPAEVTSVAPHQSMISPLPQNSLTYNLQPIRDASQQVHTSVPCDALLQLVAEGKISKDDYLKLAPNKGTPTSMVEETRLKVLNRCSTALMKLESLVLPNRLIMNNSLISKETVSLTPKFCSPLKRQATVEFHFTKATGAPYQRNKKLVDSIISTIGLQDVVSKLSKKTPKNMKDSATQTVKPFCDVCEVRANTVCYDTGTSIDQEYFSSSVHTQVIEQDLASSRTVFNLTGSGSDSAPISIAHLTPAQLVSQLAARAKTLKSAEAPSTSFNSYDRHDVPRGYTGSSHHHDYYRY